MKIRRLEWTKDGNVYKAEVPFSNPFQITEYAGMKNGFKLEGPGIVESIYAPQLEKAQSYAQHMFIHMALCFWDDMSIENLCVFEDIG